MAQQDRQDDILLVDQMAVETGAEALKPELQPPDTGVPARGLAPDQFGHRIGKFPQVKTKRLMIRIQHFEGRPEARLEGRKPREIMKILDLAMAVNLVQQHGGIAPDGPDRGLGRSIGQGPEIRHGPNIFLHPGQKHAEHPVPVEPEPGGLVFGQPTGPDFARAVVKQVAQRIGQVAAGIESVNIVHLNEC